MKIADITEQVYRERVESHLINYNYFINDDFNSYFIDRAKSILVVIEKAMGKSISDKASEQTIKLYGESLE